MNHPIGITLCVLVALLIVTVIVAVVAMFRRLGWLEDEVLTTVRGVVTRRKELQAKYYSTIMAAVESLGCDSEQLWEEADRIRATLAEGGEVR